MSLQLRRATEPVTPPRQADRGDGRCMSFSLNPTSYAVSFLTPTLSLVNALCDISFLAVLRAGA